MAPERDDGDGDEAPALDPDDLDISDDEHVREIDDNRYVVSPDDPIDAADRESTSEDAASLRDDAAERAAEREAAADAAPPLTDERVHNYLNEKLATADAAYAFDVTARFDDSVGSHRLRSDDVVAAFESLLLWSTRQIDQRTPAESVLGILLTESNLAVRYPPGALETFVKEQGLGPDDTVADLLEAAGDEDGVVFPPPGTDVRRRE